jgi:hypothetical protein
VKGAEDGTSLMLRKVLLKIKLEIEKSVQRKILFRKTCKTKDRVCKVIIDSGITDNLVSTEMVEKLELEQPHIQIHIKSHGCRKDTR